MDNTASSPFQAVRRDRAQPGQTVLSPHGDRVLLTRVIAQGNSVTFWGEAFYPNGRHEPYADTGPADALVSVELPSLNSRLSVNGQPIDRTLVVSDRGIDWWAQLAGMPEEGASGSNPQEAAGALALRLGIAVVKP